MTVEHPRLRRERCTMQTMIEIYCREQHGLPAGKLCAECQELEDYALGRLARCPFQADKPVCAKCAVHCYKPEMRERVRSVMRFAGPRMLLRHPILAVRHLLDERRKAPTLKRQRDV
jgi:hypothetical protein